MKFLAPFLLLALAPFARATDQAVVVGVAGYPGLGPQWKLKGTIADAKAMGVALGRYGFKITEVIDEAATEAGILAALTKAAAETKPGDRFVFYFAGHGCNKPLAGIGAYDAGPKGGRWISADVLNQKVKSIPALSRTVILDACFSGGMIKDVGGDVSARFYQPEPEIGNTKSAGYAEDEAPAANFPVTAQASNEVCYVAAAGPGQIAQEAVAPPGNPEKERRGVFSYFLTNQLDPAKPLSWGAAVSAVREEMVKNEVKLRLLQPQTPVVSNPFAEQPVFAAASAKPVKPAVPTTLLKLIGGERPSAASLTMRAVNDKAAMVGERRRIELTVGDAGYLVVLEQEGTKFRRIYPADAEDAAELKVGPGSPPPFFDVVSNKPGGIVLKAILLTDEKAAQALLDLMPPGREIGGEDAAVTKESFAGTSTYTTAYANMRIADDLVGGLRVANAGKAWAALRGEDALGNSLREAVQRFSDRVWKSAEKAKDDVTLKTLLNIVLTDRDLAVNLNAAGVALPGDLASLARERDAAGAIARNARILAVLMKGSVEVTK